MLQIGDIVNLKPFGETLYTITGVMRTTGPQYEPVKDPEKDGDIRPIAVGHTNCNQTELHRRRPGALSVRRR